MVEIINKVLESAGIGKSTREKQGEINVSEVFYIWDILVAKQDIMETMNLLNNLIDDQDLKFIAGKLVQGLQSGIVDMEDLINKYGIPFPSRPPAGSNSTAFQEYYTDKYIYVAIFEGIQTFFPLLSNAFMNCTTPEVRNAFKKHLLLTMDLQELIVEYGELKGYLDKPPIYRA